MAQAAPSPDPRRDPAVGVDCTTCGACCFTTDPRYIAVYEVDRRRMDAAALALTHRIGTATYMRNEGGRCAALRVSFEQGAARYRCAIYPMRPDACRWLVAGGGECHRQRDDKRSLALWHGDVAQRSSPPTVTGCGAGRGPRSPLAR